MPLDSFNSAPFLSHTYHVASAIVAIRSTSFYVSCTLSPASLYHTTTFEPIGRKENFCEYLHFHPHGATLCTMAAYLLSS